MALSASDYLEGMLFFLPMLALCVAAGITLARRRTPGPAPVEFALSVFLFTTAAVLFAHLIPGILGVLTRGAPLVTAAILLAATRVVPQSRRAPFAPPPEPPPSPRWSWALALLAVAAAAIGALAFLLTRSTHVLAAIDSMTFHLPTVARWMQTESIWGLHQFSPDFSNATYPQNGLVMQLAAVLPWHSAFLVRFVDLPFVVAMAGAVWALARELGAPSSSALIAGAASTAIPAIASPALDQAQVDAPSLAWLAIGVLFLVRWARVRDDRELLPAGVGLGLAFGTKWYDVVFVPIIVVICLIGVWLVLRRRMPSMRAAVLLARPLGILAGLVALTGGFWLIRNWVETSNPLYPAQVAPLGVKIFDAPVSRLDTYAGFNVWHYLTDASIWRHWFVPAYKSEFGLLGPVVIAAVATAAFVARRGRAETRRTVAAFALATVVLAIAYTRLPWTAYGPPGQPYLTGANARYVVPAVLGGLVLAAWLAGAAGRLRPIVEFALLAGLADCLRRSYPGVPHKEMAIAAVIVLAGTAAALHVRFRVGRERAEALWRMSWVRVAVAVLAVLVLLAVGDDLRRRAQADRYARYDPVFAYIEQHAPYGTRIGLTGLWSLQGVSPAFPAYGPRMGNNVRYIGPFVRGTLHEYGNRAKFRRAVRRGRYDLLVIGTGFARELPASKVRDIRWARSLGYRRAAGSSRLVLLRAGTLARHD